MNTQRIEQMTVLIVFLLAGNAVFARDSSITDKQIVFAINTKYMAEPGIPATANKVTARDGVVVLSGTIDTLLAKEMALKIAKATRGVKAVVDDMHVKASLRSDAAIRSDMENQLRTDSALGTYHLIVHVNSGVATLTGKVHSWAERQLAAEAVRGVRGAREVKNQIAVIPNSKRTDAEIAADVRDRLGFDVYVNRDDLSASVKDGVVTLNGAVGSVAEKEAAFTDAAVFGIASVNDDHVKILAGGQPNLRRAGKILALSDEDISKAIRKAFADDPRVGRPSPNLKVSDGIVTLKGDVRDNRAKAAAQADAKNTLGVLGVTNLLQVRVAGTRNRRD